MIPRLSSRILGLLWVVCGSFAAHAVPVPLPGSAPMKPEALRSAANPALLPMMGQWKFELTRGELTAGGQFVASTNPKASSFQAANPPGNALFQTTKESHWCANGASFPQWWEVDLGEAMPVQGLELAFEKKDYAYGLKVEGSLEGKSWFLLADPKDEVKNGPLKTALQPCRYLRLTFLGAHDEKDAKRWAYLSKVAITVLKDGRAVPWAPKASEEETRQPDRFAGVDFNDAQWSEIPVPGNWEMEGYSKPTYNQPDDAAGLYRRWVEVPASFKGKRVLWHFDGVFDSVEVFINGEKVGSHESGYTAFDLDVTRALKPGEKNLFAVRVCKKTSSVDLDTGDFWSLGGIYRENYLMAVAPLHVEDIRIVTPVKGTSAGLEASLKIEGAAGEDFALTARLYSADGKDAGMPEIQQNGKTGTDGRATVELKKELEHPRLWSAEKPDLYYLVIGISGKGGKPEFVQERFGFREVEIRDGVVLWNGVPIKATGVCRHEEWSALGHALNEAAWRKDVELMKAANINAVRTSHYNHAQRFMEWCEEAGLYVLDEVPGCWCDPKSPKMKPAWLQRTAETYQRDKNRPCVLAWSIGNESGFGEDNLAALEAMKQLDPTRPAFISCSEAKTLAVDFDDYHYPTTAKLDLFVSSPQRATTPFVITEGPHIFYVPGALAYDYGCKDLWGEALARQWAYLWKTPGALGAFIWEWQDQGLADKFGEKDGVDPVAAALAGTQADAGSGAAAQTGSSSALRGNNNKGIVDGYRVPKAEYWHVKMNYSPVVIEVREAAVKNGEASFPLRNRYAFTDLAELTCKWRALAGDKKLSEGEAHFTCPPGSASEGRVPAVEGAETLALEFIHPDGRSLYSARLRMPGARPDAAPAKLAAQGGVRVEEKEGAWVIRAAGTELSVDKATGQIRSWRKDGGDLVTSGPVFNLGEQRLYEGEHAWRVSKPLPLVQSKSAPVLKNVTADCRPAEKNAGAAVSVKGDVYLAESPESLGRLEYVLTVQPDAQIDVNWKLDWSAADHEAFELGMKMRVPASLKSLAWSREGQWTDYPPSHIGAASGKAAAGDLSFRCTKRDVHWISMAGDGGTALAALPLNAAPLHTRCVPEGDSTVLFLSSTVAAPRDFSVGLLPEYRIWLLKGHSASGAFSLRAAAR